MIAPITSGIAPQKAAPTKHQVAVTPEEADAFAAQIGAISPIDLENQPSSSETDHDGTVSDAELWKSFHQEVNNQAFQRTNRILSYYEQKMKEIDYGNK